MPRSTAALYDRKSSVTIRSETAYFLRSLRDQLQRGVLVSLGLDQHIEDLALGVDGPPEVDHSAGDFQIDLVQMPRRMRLRATLSQVGRVSSVRNGSPNAEPSRKTPPLRVPPTNPRRHAS